MSDRHPSITAALARLEPNPHLSGDAFVIAQRYSELGQWVASVLPDDPDTADALRKLWESKNCAVYVAARIGLEGS